MILYFDPFKEIIDIYNKIKTVDFDIIIEWVQNTDLLDEKGNQCYGVTIWSEDNGAIIIHVSAEIDLPKMSEILAHEFAHVLTGIKGKHGKKWKEMFDYIHDEFIEKVNVYSNMVKDAEITFKEIMNGRLIQIK